MDEPQNQPGQEPNDEQDVDAQSGDREQHDQQADGSTDRERQLSAEARRYRLAASEARARIKELEDQGKTEMQRVQDENAANAKRAEIAEAKALRLEVAAEFGIPSQHVKRLAGDTRAELVEDAKALAKEFGIDPNDGSERPNFSSGVRRPVQRPKTMNDVIRQAAGR